MSEIQLTGIDAGMRTPGYFAEIEFGQGPSSAAAGERQVVFVMPMSSAGNWTANKLYPVKNTGEAEVGAGAGSPMHRGIAKFISINPDARVYALPYSATTGGTPTAATNTLTLATVPTGIGTISCWIANVLCQYTFQEDEALSDIGDGLAASINAKSILPCTAANSAGVVTLTAKIPGASQGTATLGVIRCRVEVTTGKGLAATLAGPALGAVVAGADGDTAESANLNSALTAIDSVRKYYIVTSANDATSLGLIKAHVIRKSLPKRGLRSRFIFGYTGSLGTCQTLATGLNYVRTHVAHQYNSELDSAQLAATLAAVLQSGEGRSASENFNGRSLSPYVPAVAESEDWPDEDDIEDAIVDGITTFASNDSGAYIVQSVTTRSKNDNGTLNDSRASRSLKVSVADKFTDTCLIRFANTLSGKRFKDDVLDDEGNVDTSQKYTPGVVKPSQVSSIIVQVLDEMEDLDLQNVDKSKQSISAKKSSVNAGRAVTSLDLHVIDWFDQATLRVAEVSQG